MPSGILLQTSSLCTFTTLSLYVETIWHQHPSSMRQDLFICDICGAASAVIVVIDGEILAMISGVMSL